MKRLMPSRTRRSRHRALRVCLAAAALATTIAIVPSGGSPAGAENAATCDTAAQNTTFTNAVVAADRTANAAMVSDLRASGTLFLCTNLSQFFDVSTVSVAGHQPGDVLRSRPLYPSPAGPSTTAFRVMYVTTLVDGTLAATTGLVVMPNGAPGDRRIVGYAHGTVGIAASCFNVLDYSWLTAAGRSIANQIVGAGSWDSTQPPSVMIAPDFVGIGAKTPGRDFHSYLVKDEEGNAMLDMARAASNLSSVTKVATGANQRVAVAGFSQGGHVVLSTLERGVTYAPDVDLVGAAALAPPVSVDGLAQDLANKRTASTNDQYFLAAMAFGMEKVYGTSVINPAELLSSATRYGWPYYRWDSAYSVMKTLLSDNGGAIIGLLQGPAGVQILPTVGQFPAYQDKLFNDAEGFARYTTNNTAFASPVNGYTIAGCGNQGAADALTSYAVSLGGGTILAQGYEKTTTWKNMIRLADPASGTTDGPLRANSPVPNPGTPAATFVGMATCDPVTQLIRNTASRKPLPECLNPYSAPVVTPELPSWNLQPGWEGSYGINYLFSECVGAPRGPASAKLYGAIDFNMNGNDDITGDDTIPMNQQAIRNHSNLTSNTPAVDDAIHYVKSAFAHADHPDDPAYDIVPPDGAGAC